MYLKYRTVLNPSKRHRDDDGAIRCPDQREDVITSCPTSLGFPPLRPIHLASAESQKRFLRCRRCRRRHLRRGGLIGPPPPPPPPLLSFPNALHLARTCYFRGNLLAALLLLLSFFSVFVSYFLLSGDLMDFHYCSIGCVSSSQTYT